MKREPFVLKEDCTFDYVVENKNDPQLGQFLNTIFEKIEDDNKSKLSGVDEEIQLLKDELEAIKLQKKGLMQQLLTGKIRVKI